MSATVYCSMQLLAVAAVAALSVAPLDQFSDTVVVRNVSPGARIDVYDNGFWLGAAVARGRLALVAPVRALEPGDQIVVVARFGSSAAFASPASTVEHDYATYHYDNLRTGWNNVESVLTPSNVGSSSFGQAFSTPVDGNVIAQPLLAANLAIPGHGTLNVLYVATENDSVYALDAATGSTLWTVNYAATSQGSPLSSSDVGCRFISPAIGITGTPVFDRASQTLYFVADVKRTQGGVTTFHQFFHAVDLTTGVERPGSPVDIQASVRRASRMLVQFDARNQMQRPGLLLRHGVVYIGFGSYCDLHRSTVHGWILAYAASTLAPVAVFNTSAGSAEGLSSVWAGGYALAADRNGSIYFATGNGEFNGNTGGSFWGDTVLRLSSSLTVQDYFTPHDQSLLNQNDLDLGGGGPMLLPPQAGAFPRLLVEEGKERVLFLIDRDRMGEYTPGGPDHVVQELVGAVGVTHGVWGGPAYYADSSGNPFVFYGGGQDHLKSFALMTSPMTGLVLVGESMMTYGGEGGTIPAVSSNGMTAGTAVVWAVERPHMPDEKVRLTAYPADNLTRRLVDSSAGPWFNTYGGFFVVPTVIDGRVYVGTANSVTGFGLR